MESPAISMALSFASDNNVASAVAASVTSVLFDQDNTVTYWAWYVGVLLFIGCLWVRGSHYQALARTTQEKLLLALLENSETAEKLTTNSNSLSELQEELADTKRQLALVTDELQASVSLTNSLIDDAASYAHSLGHARMQIMELERTLEESESTTSVQGHRIQELESTHSASQRIAASATAAAAAAATQPPPPPQPNFPTHSPHPPPPSPGQPTNNWVYMVDGSPVVHTHNCIAMDWAPAEFQPGASVSAALASTAMGASFSLPPAPLNSQHLNILLACAHLHGLTVQLRCLPGGHGGEVSAVAIEAENHGMVALVNVEGVELVPMPPGLFGALEATPVHALSEFSAAGRDASFPRGTETPLPCAVLAPA